MTTSSATRVLHEYDRAQRGFHWVMAGLILVGLALGIWAAYLPPGTSPRREILDFHKSIGMTVLVLVPLRLVYRFIVGEPAYREAPHRLAHLSARVAHASLYVLMFAMPLTGYLYSAGGGYSLPWFGLFTWPRLLPKDTHLSELGYILHYWAAWIVGSILAIHVLAVVWHQRIKRDEVLARMWPSKVNRQQDGAS